MTRPGPYAEYRPAHSAWLDGIPAHWVLSRFGYEALLNVGQVDPRNEPWADMTLVAPNHIEGGTGRLLGRETAREQGADSGKYTVVAGQIIYSKIRPALNKAAVATEDCLCSADMYPMSFRKRVDQSYALYQLLARPFHQFASVASSRVKMPKVNREELSEAPWLVPPLHEQRTIADYLDRETAQIDALIGKQERLIETLRERRAAVVERAVSLGLDTAPTKPSGLTWTKSVPDHWGVANIRRFAQMKTGHTPSRSTPEYWTDCSIPWVTLADVWQLRDGRLTWLSPVTKARISELGLANSAAELLPAGTVVLSRTASVGFTGIMPVPMATSQDYWNWVCGPGLLPEFLVWAFRAMRKDILGLMIGSTHKTIYQPIAASIAIAVPPLDEQRRIVASLDEQTAKIDALIAKAKCLIEVSKERRSALITAAVTGQIDVRNRVDDEQAQVST